MIFSESKANEFRCCGPEGCGKLPETPPMVAKDYLEQADYDRLMSPSPMMTVERMTGAVITGPRYCIGAKCAAWTWVDSRIEYDVRRTPSKEQAKANAPDGAGWTHRGEPYKGGDGGWTQKWERQRLERRGGCGHVLKVAVSGDVDQILT